VIPALGEWRQFNSFVVQDVARVIRQAVLAVAGEGVQRHVGHHPQLRKLLFELAYHAGHQAVRVPGFLAIDRLEVGIDHREQRHHRNAQLHALLSHWQQQVEAQALHAGHRGHGLAALLAVEHKHRVNRVMRRQRMLAHQVAGEVVAAQSARAGQWVGCLGSHGENCA
jgi:hypothetical protein